MLYRDNKPTAPIVLNYVSHRRRKIRLTKRSAVALVAATILTIGAIVFAAQFIWIVRSHIEYGRSFCGTSAYDPREPAHRLSLCVMTLGGAAVCGIKAIRIMNGSADLPPYG